MLLTRRRVHLSGPTGALSIGRTNDGIVRVDAARFADLAFGLGWAHAHDRLVQMTLVRLIGQGRAAEQLAGTEQMIGIDCYMRRMGFVRDARDQVAHLSEPARNWIETYCSGINEYLNTHSRPFELILSGHRPEPWSAEDVLLTMKLMSYQGLAQSQGLVEKFIIQAYLAGVDREKLKELFHPHLEGFDPAWLEGVNVTEPLIPPSVAWCLPSFKASNNWALAGNRTASGSPMFCNDPHLECDRLPPVWHESILISGGAYLMGASVPGIPMVLVGRNSRLTWGITYGFMDQIDYFVEDCRDGKFRHGEQWLPFETREELIRVKGGGERRVQVHENLHGVLEGDPSRPGRYLCRGWSAHRGVIARTADHLMSLLKASTVSEGMDAVAGITISLNWVLADRDGSIGYQQSGALPVRKHSGLHPVPGWDPSYDWQGLAEPSELNRSLNPASGFVVTANDDLNPPGGPLVINMPMGDYRARRIRGELASTGNARVEDMMRLQNDLYSLQAKEILELVRPYLPDSPEGRALAGWDCRYGADSLECARFEQLYRELIETVFGENGFGEELMRYLFDDTIVIMDFYRQFDRILFAPDSVWFTGRSREELFRRAVARAFERPVKSWGEQRKVTMRNLFFQGKLPRFLGFDHDSMVVVGSRATILQGAVYKSLGLPMTCAPSYRFIADLASEVAHTVLPGGPSGRRFSPWYLTDLERWKKGEYKVLKP